MMIDKDCPCCDCRDFTKAFSTVEFAFDGESSLEVHYYTCTFCGYTFKDPLVPGIDKYYAESWQSPPRPHADEARWVAETLRGHSTCSLPSAFDAGARRYDLLNAIGQHMTLGDLNVMDPNTGGGFMGTGSYKPPGKYDLVCSTHVLEHVVDVTTFMEDLKALSSKYIFLEVPSPELESWNETNDDIARTHLHHFTLTSLIALCHRHGLFVLRADSAPGDRNQNNRLMLGIHAPDGCRIMRSVRDSLKLAYGLALDKFVGLDPSKVGLYGKSDAYYKFTQLDERVREFKVFDLYRGTLDGIFEMERVVITPRQPQVREELKAYLDLRGVSWTDPWEATGWELVEAQTQ